jgi:HAD superfamily hydrolase (TIGR01509 family)
MTTIPDTIRYMLLDMDGTLVDTEPLGPAICEKLFQDNGVMIADDEKDLFVKVWRRDGTDINLGHYMAIMTSRYRIRIPHSDLTDEFYARYKVAMSQAKELPGATRFIANARKHGMRLALVTSNTRTEAQAILDSHSWTDYFDVIVCEEDITRFKPHPEPYQLAIRKLGAKPEHCLVLEDAKNGAISGSAAQAHVIGLRAGNDTPQDLSAADEVVDTFDDLHFGVLTIAVEQTS